MQPELSSLPSRVVNLKMMLSGNEAVLLPTSSVTH